jgi:hypothetical protein
VGEEKKLTFLALNEEAKEKRNGRDIWELGLITFATEFYNISARFKSLQRDPAEL